VLQLLEAMLVLPGTAIAQLSFVIAGPVDPDIRDEVDRLVDLVQARPGAHVDRRDQHLSDEEGFRLIAGADLCLLPYQRHIGSSNVLLKAAAAGVPVLGPDYGLVGRYVRDHSLGLVVDTESPRAIAAALQTFAERRGVERFDASAAAALASSHSVERFTAALTEHWLDRPS
jgi:glycosyltransferase involved in cell wall biosynthesis